MLCNRWLKLSHLFVRRMQRLPNLLPALDGLSALTGGQLCAAQVLVDLDQLGLKMLAGIYNDGVDLRPTQRTRGGHAVMTGNDLVAINRDAAIHNGNAANGNRLDQANLPDACCQFVNGLGNQWPRLAAGLERS